MIPNENKIKNDFHNQLKALFIEGSENPEVLFKKLIWANTFIAKILKNFENNYGEGTNE